MFYFFTVCLCVVDFGDPSSSEWQVTDPTAEGTIWDIPVVRHLEVSNRFWVKMWSWISGGVWVVLPFDEDEILYGALAVQDTVYFVLVFPLMFSIVHLHVTIWVEFISSLRVRTCELTLNWCFSRCGSGGFVLRSNVQCLCFFDGNDHVLVHPRTFCYVCESICYTLYPCSVPRIDESHILCVTQCAYYCLSQAYTVVTSLIVSLQ